MIGYVCKYTPYALLEGFSQKCKKIEPKINSFHIADSLTHVNMCSFSKALLQYCMENSVDEILLVNCCDSLKRIKDVLEAQNKIKFVYFLDLPKKNTCCSKKIYKNEFIKFIKAYESYSNKAFDIKKFKDSFTYKKEDNIKTSYISLMGARVSENLVNSIKKFSNIDVINNTCTGVQENFLDMPKSNDLDVLMGWYAERLLGQIPCMRMEKIEDRRRIIMNPNLKGIIYHTIKFCDYYGFEYKDLKREVNIPILKIETDYTSESEGQIKTRLEAFMESMKCLNIYTKTKEINKKNNRFKRFVAGIDSGSTSTNVVILNRKKEIIAYSIVNTGAKASQGANRALEEALNKANLKKEDLQKIVSTGYGRISINFADKDVTEITCHAKGANFLNSNIRTVIDIGGQDSKVIKIDEKGNVKDFVMNDKCAAGTGRFLEMMAKTLEISMNDMSQLGLKWNEDINISSMCTVFAESEVISLIAQNKEKRDIIHGLNKSVASKVYSLVNRVGNEDEFIITGGVAKNLGIIKAIEEKIKSKLMVPNESQICGALGAALIALDDE